LIRIFKNDIELYESQLSIESFIEIEYLVSADNRKNIFLGVLRNGIAPFVPKET